MVNPSDSNGFMGMVVTVILALVVVGAVMIPVVNTVTEPVKIPHTIFNTGDAMAITDGDTHSIQIGLDGNYYVVSTDGTDVRTIERAADVQMPNPFNLYYAAINLASGDNADDSGETRLSKEKGAVAYVLNPDNLRQTVSGYTFDTTLYNVMLVIPPVYWYSDGTDKLYVASSPDAFDGLTLKDYAHTYTSDGVTGHTDAIAIGVYEAYNLNGVMVSQADRTPTAGTSLTQFVGLANAGNTDNSNSTYRVWNYFDWTLYKIMCWMIMGNTDSQYMMGAGPTSMSASSVTGLTTSAIQKSANAQSSVSLLLENTWGSLYEWLGDTVNNAGTLVAGNTLVQPTTAANVVNVLEETVTMPTSSGYYDTINTFSDVFGIVATVKSSAGTAGQGIRDQFYGSTGTPLALSVGGGWYGSGSAGISSCLADYGWGATVATIGSRLACSLGAGAAPVETSDYAYVLTFDNSNGVTISDVSVVNNGQTTTVMPTGTTLNPYWEFGRSASKDFLSPDVYSTLISIGEDNIALFYSNGYMRVYDESGYYTTDRVTAESPINLTVSEYLSYADDSATDRTASSTYYAGDGDYVVTHDGEGTFIEDIPLTYYFPYTSTATRTGVSVQFAYVGSGTIDEPETTILAPSGATYESTETVITVTEDVDSVTDIGISYKSYWNIVDYTESYSQSVLLPKQIDYTTEGEGLGTAGVILGVVPIFVIIGVLLSVAAYISPQIRNRL